MSLREDLAERYDDDLLFLDPPEDYDKCILGVADRIGMEPCVVYDRAKVIQVLMDGGMDAESAEEFFEFNMAGSYMGTHTPMFLYPLEPT
jgi:hypothetical protein